MWKKIDVLENILAIVTFKGNWAANITLHQNNVSNQDRFSNLHFLQTSRWEFQLCEDRFRISKNIQQTPSLDQIATSEELAQYWKQVGVTGRWWLSNMKNHKTISFLQRREFKWKSKDVQQTTTKPNIYASENVLGIIASIRYFFLPNPSGDLSQA